MRVRHRKVKAFFSETLGTLTDLHKLTDKIKSNIYNPVGELEVTAYNTPEPVPFEQRTSGDRLSLKPGQRWGQLFDCAWFNFKGKIPAEAVGKNVVLLIDLSGEALLVDEQGKPAGILTTGSSIFEISLGDPGKTVVPITQNGQEGTPIDIWADAGNNDLLGAFQNNGTLQFANIATKNEAVEQLYYDYVVLLDLLDQLDETSVRYQKILYALHKTMIELVDFSDERISKARAHLAPELDRKNGDYGLQVTAIGHSHIDLAWLWPIRETIRKGARTFSHVLRMMEQYPDYKFGATQPQLYQWMKTHYPDLYSRIKEKVAEGQWELLGGMWIEPDSNAVGGESFIRQFLYGKKFFKEEFGENINNLIMPDTFGYSAQIPQIMKGCGVDYFVTTKISWDLYNKVPHDTFLWKGLDGSEVLAHMPPEGTYNSSAAPRAIKKAEQLYEDKATTEHLLLMYGIGDGGGGPSVDHHEFLKREENLAGIAPVTQRTVKEFLDDLNKNRHLYESWVGELYLGFHQGTYTSQAKNKWYNRKMEINLRHAEFLSSLDRVIGGANYPKAQLDELWQETLLYQFHDILPGSSIQRVHKESLERYESMSHEVHALQTAALERLSDHIATDGIQKPVIAWNTLPWQRDTWIQVKDRWQQVQVPSMGYTVVDTAINETVDQPFTLSASILENDVLKIEFDGNGLITSIYDKASDKQLMPDNQANNELAVYADEGDAWDFTPDYKMQKIGSFELESCETLVDGPLTAVIQKRVFGDSSLTQRIQLTRGSKRIDFITFVDWQEREKMLRSSFTFNIRATESVSEIQFGHVKRKTHTNTSWEDAQYEISAHKWIDISQPDYGIALLNDSKYGHDAAENLLDINLLRSPKWPDPETDKGHHYFTYALFPHKGNHLEGRVIQEAYALNMPLIMAESSSHQGKLPSTQSFVAIDVENVILETTKISEDGNSIVLRFYEAYGMSSKATIKTAFAIKNIVETNMLEEKITDLEATDSGIILSFSPFQVKTICLALS